MRVCCYYNLSGVTACVGCGRTALKVLITKCKYFAHFCFFSCFQFLSCLSSKHVRYMRAEIPPTVFTVEFQGHNKGTMAGSGDPPHKERMKMVSSLSILGAHCIPLTGHPM